MATQGDTKPSEFTPDDLLVVEEKRLSLIHKEGIGREFRNRLSAARWVAIFVLPVTAACSLGVLICKAEPPEWAQSSLFSILTAAVAFLFSANSDKKD